MRPMSACWVSLLVIVESLLVAGCGSSIPTGTVDGKVTFGDEPVGDVRVQLQSKETGAAATAVTDSDGNFHIETPLAVGEYLVTVTPNYDPPPAGTSDAPPPPPEREDVPQKFRNAATSGITIKIEAGSNTADVKMTSA